MRGARAVFFSKSIIQIMCIDDFNINIEYYQRSLDCDETNNRYNLCEPLICFSGNIFKPEVQFHLP